MRYSRHLWILGITLVCFISLFALETPSAVISAMADPQHGESPRVTVQRFWNLMDSRQTHLAQELLVIPEGSADENEFKVWENLLNKDPMLSLQKVEFVDMTNPQAMFVRVFWTSPVQNVQVVTFTMSLKQTDKGWRIQRFKRINDLSFIGGKYDGRILWN